MKSLLKVALARKKTDIPPTPEKDGLSLEVANAPEGGAKELQNEKMEDNNLDKLIMLVKDNPEAMDLIQKMKDDQNMEESDLGMEEMDKASVSGMSDYDKDSVMSSEPKSLSSRVRKEALDRLSK